MNERANKWASRAKLLGYTRDGHEHNGLLPDVQARPTNEGQPKCGSGGTQVCFARLPAHSLLTFPTLLHTRPHNPRTSLSARNPYPRGGSETPAGRTGWRSVSTPPLLFTTLTERCVRCSHQVEDALVGRPGHPGHPGLGLLPRMSQLSWTRRSWPCLNAS